MVIARKEGARVVARNEGVRLQPRRRVLDPALALATEGLHSPFEHRVADAAKPEAARHTAGATKVAPLGPLLKLFAFTALLLTTACGYHTGGNNAPRLPSDLHTIYVQGFERLADVPGWADLY